MRTTTTFDPYYNGERAGENRLNGVRPGGDGDGGDACTSHDRLADDKASLHRFQEGP